MDESLLSGALGAVIGTFTTLLAGHLEARRQRRRTREEAERMQEAARESELRAALAQVRISHLSVVRAAARAEMYFKRRDDLAEMDRSRDDLAEATLRCAIAREDLMAIASHQATFDILDQFEELVDEFRAALKQANERVSLNLGLTESAVKEELRQLTAEVYGEITVLPARKGT